MRKDLQERTLKNNQGHIHLMLQRLHGPVTYWSGLNGRGRHSNVSYTQTRSSVFCVKPNNVYRFRLIGAQSLFAYRVSIDEHKLKVIATDGSFVQPVFVDYIIIHSGKRYDFLLKT